MTGIMVVNAVGEPYTFQIDSQRLEFITVSVYPSVLIDSLQSLSDAEIVSTKLIESNVTAIKGCL